ncbi:MAG: proton extrusion protein PcxA [Elainellaceae cyanobacterium]
MTSSRPNPIQALVKAANQWLLKTPERSLDEAYEAALTIKSIEDTHFNGRKVSPDFGNYSQNVYAYFQAELKKYLNIIKLRLTEFRTSSSVFRLVNVAEGNVTGIEVDRSTTDVQTLDIIDQPRETLRKLKFIDEVLVRYGSLDEPSLSKASGATQGRKKGARSQRNARRGRRDGEAIASRTSPETARMMAQNQGRNQKQTPLGDSLRAIEKTGRNDRRSDAASMVDKTGVLPRSILRTVDRIKRELDPEAEEEIVEEFRDSKNRTIVSLRFILLLIIIPLLTHQVAKNFIVGPAVDYARQGEEVEIFLNGEMEEEALQELQHYDERLRFEILLGKAPRLNEEEIEDRVRDKAVELERKYQRRSGDAVKNVFSDILSVVAFGVILVNSKREIAALKTFIDELVYGLSDSAKAFIIILFTDTFVGFHSPHGWEVLLEGISRHLGLPANRDFIFLFIATFPVILDTVFKYWIFRYLNRISPSAVATYKNMNE